MIRLAILLVSLLCLFQSNLGQTKFEWKAGKEVCNSYVGKIGLDSFFCSMPITDKIFERIRNKSFKKNCTTSRGALRYLRLLHINANGKPQTGELICNKSIASDLINIFKKLYSAGYRIERMILIDEYNADDETSMSANNTACFNFRKIQGSKNLSKHSTGMAIDINPRYNPCVHTKTGLIEPANGKAYAHNRNEQPSASFCLINHNDLCYKLFKAHGFRWGGDWRTNIDYQHFEK